ncbi:hypothetical protein OR214_02041 [Ralstonia pickettii OR214]|jgi:hypothetical protein|uniref:Uncharacterized protein n=2 Tax=Ralstonia pickettii TaxID=329 RepID=R0CMS9_RALPI|nr:hypothetical protein OR214_02041 [Ralstonia pickettii OR214]
MNMHVFGGVLVVFAFPALLAAAAMFGDAVNVK